MTDLAIRAVSIAEHAQKSARLAADTWEHQPNPHEPGTDEHAKWAACYSRWFDHFMNEESEG
jgi:hypothetical protein